MRMTFFSRRAVRIAALPLAAFLALSGPALAQDRATGLQIDSNRPVQIEGDQLEVLEDESKAVFTGNVSVVQDKTVLRTGKLVIFYVKSGESASITSGGSKIRRLEASGGVNIQSGAQVATGDAAVYEMATETLVLSGKRVTLSEGGNVATGCKLTVLTNTGRAKLQGCGEGGSRPTILLQPSSGK